MIANRALEFDDYLAMVRRHLKLLLIVPPLALLAGYLTTYVFSSKYTSESLIGVEKQTVSILPNAPWVQVKPPVVAPLRERMTALQQRVLSHNQLQTLVNRLGLAKDGKTAESVIADIQSNVIIAEAEPPGTPPPAEGSSGPPRNAVPPDPTAFSISVTADSPRTAQQICRGVTSLLLEENLKDREQEARSTSDFLAQQLQDAKNSLDENEKKVAAFKALYLGQLPGDVDNNIKILGELKSQLDADTQLLNRTQQDKSYEESLLAQQLTAWKSSLTFRTSENIEQRLATLQTQLLALQTQYTEDHPEIVRMKGDIAALEAKQKELRDLSNEKGGKVEADIKEPLEIRQRRDQIHQHEAVIAQVTEDQRELQEKIKRYQSRLTLSPRVEEEYKQLTRDDDAAHQIYNSILISINQSEIQADLERRQQAEQLRLLDDASLPGSASFPDRRKLALYGLAAGLALSISFGLWSEFRDKTLRDERDVVASLELPMLTNIPWVGAKRAAAVNAR